MTPSPPSSVLPAPVLELAVVDGGGAAAASRGEPVVSSVTMPLGVVLLLLPVLVVALSSSEAFAGAGVCAAVGVRGVAGVVEVTTVTSAVAATHFPACSVVAPSSTLRRTVGVDVAPRAVMRWDGSSQRRVALRYPTLPRKEQ